MERGSYIAASGGLLQFRKLEVVNNNLANVNTPGFKKQILTGDMQSFDDTLASQISKDDPYAQGDHDRSPGTINVRAATDFSLGPIKATGNPLDVALRNPNDFFVIQTPNGPEYTRAGNFTLNQSGELVTADGLPVQGDGGNITVTGPGASIGPGGAVTAGTQKAGSLQVVRFDDPQTLVRSSGGRFSLPAGQPAPTAVEADIIPSSIEMANVSAISSVIDLITAQRAFEMYTKTAQSIDQLNQVAISQIGRTR